MFITTLVLFGIFTLKICVVKVYKSFLINLLELCFLLNLGILSATLYYLKGNSSSDGSICKCTSASISVSVVLFIGILIYHAYLQLNKTRCFTSIKDGFLAKWHTRPYRTIPAEEENTPPNTIQGQLTSMIREEFLESDS